MLDRGGGSKTPRERTPSSSLPGLLASQQESPFGKEEFLVAVETSRGTRGLGAQGTGQLHRNSGLSLPGARGLWRGRWEESSGPTRRGWREGGRPQRNCKREKERPQAMRGGGEAGRDCPEGRPPERGACGNYIRCDGKGASSRLDAAPSAKASSDLCAPQIRFSSSQRQGLPSPSSV